MGRRGKSTVTLMLKINYIINVTPFDLGSWARGGARGARGSSILHWCKIILLIKNSFYNV